MLEATASGVCSCNAHAAVSNARISRRVVPPFQRCGRTTAKDTTASTAVSHHRRQNRRRKREQGGHCFPGKDGKGAPRRPCCQGGGEIPPPAPIEIPRSDDEGCRLHHNQTKRAQSPKVREKVGVSRLQDAEPV